MTSSVGTGHSRTRLFGLPVLAFLLDIAGTGAAFALAFWLRFYSIVADWIPVTHGIPKLSSIAFGVIIGSIILVALLALRKLYVFIPGRGYRDDLPKLIKQIAVAWILVIAANFFYRDDSWSRVMYLMLLGCWFFSGLFFRWLLFRVKRTLHDHGRGLLRTILIGHGEYAKVLDERLPKQRFAGLDYLGWIADEDDSGLLPERKLGHFDQLETLLSELQVERVVVAIPASRNDLLERTVELLTGKNVELAYVPVHLQTLASRLESRDISGISVLELKGVPLAGWNAVIKRVFDFCFSGIFLLLLSPLYALLALLVKLSSPGPIFYGQERVTINGKVYKCWKFRSMRSDAEKKSGAVWAVKNDPRVTTIGKILRRSSLDELPQLWNVFIGEMSIVGPRPERPVFVEQFSREIPRYHERHRVRTGLTGWAQVNGLRGQVPISLRTTADLAYVENWTFGLDIKIIMMTFYAVIWGEDAY